MYCSHFNLKKKPFQLSSDNSFLWLGETHARALDLLKQGIDGSEQLLVLSGDIGTGKTILIHELRHRLGQTTAVAHISDPSIELNHLFFLIAQGLGFDELYRDGEDFDRVLWAFLNRQGRVQKRCLIIIDEAHLIPEQFLAQLPSWTKFAPDNTLTILLSGQLELHQVMEKALGRSWEGQVDIHAMLSPLKEKQTREYIDRRLELAGATHKIFVPGAVREVYGYTKGIPRRINIACDQAMIAAYSNEMKTVDARIFKEAVGVLKLPPVSAGLPDLVPVSQSSLAAPGFRRPAKKRSVLAAAVFFAAIICIVYFRNFSNPDKIPKIPMTQPAAQQEAAVVQVTAPTPANLDDHGGPTGAAVLQEAFQTTPQAQLASSDKKDTQSGGSADMDAFINEVFIMNKSDSITRGANQSPQPAAGSIPEIEKSTSAPAGPSATRRQYPESAPESEESLTDQPDPDAIIDWLIKEKFR